MAKKQPRSKRTTAPAKKAAARPKPVPVEPAAPTEIEHAPLPSAWQLGRQSLQLLWVHRRLFAWLLGIYLVIDLLLVHGAAQFNVAALKSSLGSLGQHGGGLIGGFTVFSSLFSLTAIGSSSPAGVYQFFEVILMSLVVIYALRHLTAETAAAEKLTVRSAFYRSTYPLVPFMLLLVLIAVQLIPLLLGSGLYSLVVGSGITANAVEQLVFLLIFLGLAALSVVWLTRSVMSLYIVTLPNMTPLAAFRNAKPLVTGRRFAIARKLVFLPVALFVVAAVIVVPCILLWAPLAQWVFYALTLIALFVVHSYLYTLYRELLG